MVLADKKPLPPVRPVVPLRLGLTAGAVGLVALNLVFRQEVWPYHPQAAAWGELLLAALLEAAAMQVVAMLWKWPKAYAGPWWARLVVRGVSAIFITGIIMLMLLFSLLACLFFSVPVQD